MEETKLDFQSKLKYTGKVFNYAGKDIAHKLLCEIPFFRFLDDCLIQPLKNADKELKGKSDAFAQLINQKEKTKREKSFDYELPDDIDNYRELIKHIKEKSEREM